MATSAPRAKQGKVTGTQRPEHQAIAPTRGDDYGQAGGGATPLRNSSPSRKPRSLRLTGDVHPWRRLNEHTRGAPAAHRSRCLLGFLFFNFRNRRDHMVATSDSQAMPDFMTVNEFRRLLRVSRGTADRLMKTPGFPMIRNGKIIRIPRQALEEWIRKQTRSRPVVTITTGPAMPQRLASWRWLWGRLLEAPARSPRPSGEHDAGSGHGLPCARGRGAGAAATVERAAAGRHRCRDR